MEMKYYQRTNWSDNRLNKKREKGIRKMSQVYLEVLTASVKSIIISNFLFDIE